VASAIVLIGVEQLEVAKPFAKARKKFRFAHEQRTSSTAVNCHIFT